MPVPVWRMEYKGYRARLPIPPVHLRQKVYQDTFLLVLPRFNSVRLANGSIFGQKNMGGGTSNMTMELTMGKPGKSGIGLLKIGDSLQNWVGYSDGYGTCRIKGWEVKGNSIVLENGTL